MSEKYCGLCGTTLINIGYSMYPCWVQLDTKMVKTDEICVCEECEEE